MPSRLASLTQRFIFQVCARLIINRKVHFVINNMRVVSFTLFFSSTDTFYSPVNIWDLQFFMRLQWITPLLLRNPHAFMQNKSDNFVLYDKRTLSKRGQFWRINTFSSQNIHIDLFIRFESRPCILRTMLFLLVQHLFFCISTVTVYGLIEVQRPIEDLFIMYKDGEI